MIHITLNLEGTDSFICSECLLCRQNRCHKQIQIEFETCKNVVYLFLALKNLVITLSL